MTVSEVEKKIEAVLSELIAAAQMDDNLLYTLRITPAEGSAILYVASINASTKVQTGKERVILIEKSDLGKIVSACEAYIDPVSVNMEGKTYHYYFFPIR